MTEPYADAGVSSYPHNLAHCQCCNWRPFYETGLLENTSTYFLQKSDSLLCTYSLTALIN